MKFFMNAPLLSSPERSNMARKTCVFLCVEPHYIAVDRRIGLGASSAPAGNLGHKSGFKWCNRIRQHKAALPIVWIYDFGVNLPNVYIAELFSVAQSSIRVPGNITAVFM